MILIIILFAGILLYAITSAGVRAPGKAMGNKFRSLGDMHGKTLQEIVAVVGDPISTADMGGDKTLYQWAASGFHIALLFSGQTCDSISSVYGATAK
jgi:hypothetical protein